jgi:hypothetical protein
MSDAKKYFTDYPVGKIYKNADSFFIITALGYDIVKEKDEFVPGEVKSVQLLQLPRGVCFWNKIEKFKKAVEEERLLEFVPTEIYVED